MDRFVRNVFSRKALDWYDNASANDELTRDEFHLFALEMIDAVAKSEREACAKIAEAQEGPFQIGDGTPCSCGDQVARSIRERCN